MEQYTYDICPICREYFEIITETAIPNGCIHEFCAPCLREALISWSDCPCCRAQVNSITITNHTTNEVTKEAIKRIIRDNFVELTYDNNNNNIYEDEAASVENQEADDYDHDFDDDVNDDRERCFKCKRKIDPPDIVECIACTESYHIRCSNISIENESDWENYICDDCCNNWSIPIEFDEKHDSDNDDKN